MKIATFSNGLEFRLTEEDARLVSHPFDCSEDVQRLIAYAPYVAAQIAALTKKQMVAELADYGAWSEDELNAKSHADLAEIVVWLAGGYICDGDCIDDEPAEKIA